MPTEMTTADLRRICDLPMQLANEAESVLKRLQTVLDDAAAQLDVRGADIEDDEATARMAVAVLELRQAAYHVGKVQDCIRSAAGVT